MEYKKSEKTGFKERENKEWDQEVHIRQENRGVMMYAVFDDKEQVSDEYGPLNETEVIMFAEGYSTCKEKYYG